MNHARPRRLLGGKPPAGSSGPSALRPRFALPPGIPRGYAPRAPRSPHQIDAPKGGLPKPPTPFDCQHRSRGLSCAGLRGSRFARGLPTRPPTGAPGAYRARLRDSSTRNQHRGTRLPYRFCRRGRPSSVVEMPASTDRNGPKHGDLGQKANLGPLTALGSIPGPRPIFPR